LLTWQNCHALKVPKWATHTQSHSAYNVAVATLNTCWLQILRTTCSRGSSSMVQQYGWANLSTQLCVLNMSSAKFVSKTRPQIPDEDCRDGKRGSAGGEGSVQVPPLQPLLWAEANVVFTIFSATLLLPFCRPPPCSPLFCHMACHFGPLSPHAPDSDLGSDLACCCYMLYLLYINLTSKHAPGKLAGNTGIFRTTPTAELMTHAFGTNWPAEKEPLAFPFIFFAYGALHILTKVLFFLVWNIGRWNFT